jgi:arsenate reductase
MAEAILRNFDKNLKIFSAGLEPVDHVSSIAIEVMAEINIDLKQSVPKKYTEFLDAEFDYIITVGEGTNEEIELPNIKYKRKMHLGFRSPYKKTKSHQEIRENCREVRDELMTELDYFYHRILSKNKQLN